MSVEVTLEYRRIGNSMSSQGRLVSKDGGLVTEEGDFGCLEYREMLKLLASTLTNWPAEEYPALKVFVHRTDREGLLPYALDQRTVDLLRADPVAGIEALSFAAASPSLAELVAKREAAPPAPATLKVGHATLADAFGDNVAFRVRGHELECPGCGFWGMFTTPGLLNHEERAGQTFKTVFVCPKRCHGRFVVSCQREWGFVEVTYLLHKTALDSFYFPRAWNGGQPWVSRESLQQKYTAYLKEKESTP